MADIFNTFSSILGFSTLHFASHSLARIMQYYFLLQNLNVDKKAILKILVGVINLR